MSPLFTFCARADKNKLSNSGNTMQAHHQNTTTPERARTPEFEPYNPYASMSTTRANTPDPESKSSPLNNISAQVSTPPPEVYGKSCKGRSPSESTRSGAPVNTRMSRSPPRKAYDIKVSEILCTRRKYADMGITDSLFLAAMPDLHALHRQPGAAKKTQTTVRQWPMPLCMSLYNIMEVRMADQLECPCFQLCTGCKGRFERQSDLTAHENSGRCPKTYNSTSGNGRTV